MFGRDNIGPEVEWVFRARGSQRFEKSLASEFISKKPLAFEAGECQTMGVERNIPSFTSLSVGLIFVKIHADSIQ